MPGDGSLWPVTARIASVLLLLVAGCRLDTSPPPSSVSPETTVPPSIPTTAPATTGPSTTTTTTTTAPSTTSTTTTASTTTTLPPGVEEPPEWLGTRPLPTDENGDPVALPTPDELTDRRFVTPDHLPPPEDGAYLASIDEVPPGVAARSTWEEGCPIALEDLAYLTVTFRGFDQLPHTGELLVASSVADDVVSAFYHIYEAGFPIEEMRIATPADLEAEPTGDGNVTTAFVCRPVTGGDGWSEHARGLAIDINPFHNPYVRGDTVLPELAGAYLDRDRGLPGTIHEGDAVTDAFDAIGWEWGGRWSSLKDYQHFSRSGR